MGVNFLLSLAPTLEAGVVTAEDKLAIISPTEAV
jgi:hypothetical protein